MKDALNKLSEQERRSMEQNIVYGIRTERNICQQEAGTDICDWESNTRRQDRVGDKEG